jgi:sugar transferase (PEP-CTERM/EpsH1 system associated)
MNEKRTRRMHLSREKPPLIMHVIRRLAPGGLENGLINLINHMPVGAYRHSIVCLTDRTEFYQRIRRDDVRIISLHKREGQDLTIYMSLCNLFRRFRPAIVHSRNLAGLDAVIPGALAGIRGRIHGEHGRDIYDLDGMNRKYRLWRMALRPLIHKYVAVSNDLADWLVDGIRVERNRVARIYNGVDVNVFHPRAVGDVRYGPDRFVSSETVVIGTVGRMEAVKDQLTLVRAFVRLLDIYPDARERLRLLMVGDGPLRDDAIQLLRNSGAEKLAWLPGERKDIPELLRSMDLFVLPSIREGLSNTILEAMASGLPVVATRVGGNPELVVEGKTGMLVPHSDAVALAEAIEGYLNDPGKLISHGQAGRKRAEDHFSIETMVSGYLNVYHRVIAERRSRSLTGNQP